MENISINYWAVLVAGLLYYFLGALWYSPLLFAKPWMRLNGFTEEDFKDKNAFRYNVAFFNSLLMSFVLAHMVLFFGDSTIMVAVETAVWLWIGFVATFTLTNYMFSNRPIKLFMIDSGYNLVGLLMMAVIISAWK